MSRKNILFIGILAAHLALYYFLFWRADRITPPGHVHAMQNADTFYPDIIRQSINGHWDYRYSYSTLPGPRIYTFLFFIVAGKIAAVFHIDPIVMYEITRATGGIAVLFATYWFIKLFLPDKLQIPAMIFTMVFETGPLWKDILNVPVWNWTAAHPELIRVVRNFWLPHHLWGEAFGLALLSTIILMIKKPFLFGPIVIIFLSIFGPLTSPTYYAIIGTSVFVPWLIYAAATKSLKRVFPSLFLAMAGIGLAALFTKSQFAGDIRLNNLIADEKRWWPIEQILREFVQSFTLYYPYVVATLLLVPFSFRKWPDTLKRSFILSLTWSVFPLGLIFLSELPWTPLVNGRIGMDVSTVPMGLLSAHIFYAGTHMPKMRRGFAFAVKTLFVLGLILSLFLSAVYYKGLIKKQDDEVFGFGHSWTLYPKQTVWDSMMYFKNVPPWSHVMNNPRIGDVLPAFVPVISYQGNPYAEPDWIPRRGLSYLFYRGDMPRNDAVKLLTDNNISYVYYGIEEKTATVTAEFYPDLLIPVYSNPDVTIYMVKLKENE